MSKQQAKSRGWAAFDLKQRQKNGLEPQTDKDPFPPIAPTIKSLHPTVLRNDEVLRKPFSSVFHPSGNVASLVEIRNSERSLLDGSSSRKHTPVEDQRSSLKKIKDLYSWADDSLVEAAVDNDIIKASNLLKAMASLSRSEENKETSIAGIDSRTDASLSDKSFSTEHVAAIAEINSTIEKCIKENRETSISGRDSSTDASLIDKSFSTEHAAAIAEINSTIEKCIKENRETSISGIDSSTDASLSDKGFSTEHAAAIAEINSTIEKCLKEKNIEWSNENDLYGQKLSNDAGNVKLTTGSLESVPIEPEWEEDDVYLRIRKDALRMMRSASQHSKAATNAFGRGDHYSAQQYSIKAREEWLAAERLNNRAAKEILSIRNSKNDIWKLDLHGLHASEAIHALQEHLEKIEREVLPNHSVPNRAKLASNILSVESFSCMATENLDQLQASSRQRPTSLQVITGIGNHSRGQAALPTAVRSFLSENGYRFEEPRPGVIAVRPKFRHR